MSLNSALADIVAYGRERVAGWRVGGLVVAIAALCFIAEAPHDAGGLLLRAALAALLVLSFRLWDDLADRAYDREHHPDRVLVRSAETKWFWILLAGLTAVSGCTIAVFGGARNFSIYAGLIVLLALVYCGPHRLTRDRFIRTQLVLLKYPVVVLLNVHGSFSRAVLAGTLGYLLLSLHEWRDDPALRERYGGARVAVVLAIGLVAALSLMTATHG